MQTLKCGRCENTREVPETIITDHMNPYNIKYMQRACWVYLRWKQNPTGGWVCGDCAMHMYAHATLLHDPVEYHNGWLVSGMRVKNRHWREGAYAEVTGVGSENFLGYFVSPEGVADKFETMYSLSGPWELE
jgi:transcription elongation factor Elf1